MTSSLSRFVRPAAVVTAVLLVVGGVQAVPASAAPTASVGHRVWLDTNRNYQWDEGEPGIPGVAMSLRLPAREPPPDGVLVSEETTTDEDGIYHFDNLKPGTRYTVILDLRAPLLKNMAIWSYPFGWEGAGNTWMYATTSPSVDTYDLINFGFIPKDRLAIDIDAPSTAVAGTSIDVKGHPYRREQPAVSCGCRVDLEFRAGGTTTWTKVSDPDAYVNDGDREVRLKVTRSGWFRYRSQGSEYVTPGVSREAHVLVSTAPVVLTATAPALVREGTPLIVTGSITRAGQPFKTGRIVLEHSRNATTWTTVADVRSTDGTLTATVQPARTGSYRFRYAGDSRTASGTSPAREVVVTPAATKPSLPRPRRSTPPTR